jgi:hypothetical protein
MLPGPMDSNATPRDAETGTKRSLAAVWLAVAVFVAFSVVEFRRCVFGDQVLVPAGSCVSLGPFSKALNDGTLDTRLGLGDVPRQIVPWRSYAATHLAAERRLPLWNDTSLCGSPLLANSQSALLYPPNLLHVALGFPPGGHVYVVIFKLALAALGAFLLARLLGCGAIAATLAGFVYGYAGLMLVWAPHTPSDTAAWLPWLVLAAERLLATQRTRWFAALSIIAALQHFAGHPETAFHSQVATSVYALVRIAMARGERGVLRPLLIFGAAMLTGALLAAPHLLPLVEYLKHGETAAARESHGPRSLVPERPWLALGFAGSLALVLFALRYLTRAPTRLRIVAAGLMMLLGTSGALLCGAPLRLASDFALMLAPQWYGLPFLHREVRIVIQATGILFLGAALPLVALGWLFGRPRVVVVWLGAVFGAAVLLGLRAPLLTELVGSLPVFDIAANQRLGWLAALAGGLLAALGIEGARHAGRLTFARTRFLALALAPLVGLLVANGVGHWYRLLPIAKNTRFPIAHGELAVEYDGPPEYVTTADGDFVRRSGRLLGKWPLVRAWFEGEVGQEFPLPLLAVGDGDVASLTSGSVPMHRRSRALADGRYESRFEVLVPRRFHDAELGLDPLVAGASDHIRFMRSDYSRESLVAKLARRTMLPRHASAYLQLALLGASILVAAIAIGAAMPALLAALLTAIVALSLFVAGERYVPTVDPARLFPSSPLLDHLAADSTNARSLFMNLSMPAEINGAYGISIVNGYDCIYAIRIAELVREATDFRDQRSPFQTLPRRDDLDTRLLGIAALKYVIDWRKPAEDAIPVEYPGGVESSRYTLHEIPEYLPRARLVRGIRVVAEADTLAALKDESCDPRHTVILESGEPREPGGDEPGEAKIILSEADRVVVEVSPRVACHLVLADTHYPGWTAKVDGEPRAILRANHAFRAVALEPGDREVEFEFDPGSFRLGLALSSLALLGLLAASIRIRLGNARHP